MKKKIFIIIPAYNESKKVGRVVNEVAKYVDKIVVVDDGSNDGTEEMVKNKKAVVLTHIINLGQGAALQTGFEYAKGNKADIVVTFDADGQFLASEIPEIVAPIIKDRTDVALGSRFLGKTKNIPFMRLFVLKFGLIFTKIFSNIDLSDTHNGFRAFSLSAIAKMQIVHNRWAHPSDIIYQIAKNQFKFVEVPVTVSYTSYSKSKGQSNFEALRIPLDLILRSLSI